MADRVNDQLRVSGRCLVVVSEGFNVGEIGEVRDSFGHVMFSASQMTVAQAVVNYLNKVGLAAKGAARANVPGTDQRHAIAMASTVDLEEAYNSGQLATLLAARGDSGHMSTILRNVGPIYSVRYDKVPLEQVANSERDVPQQVDHQERLRRDRRVRPLRAAARGRRHAQHAHGRRPISHDPLSTDLRQAIAAQVRTASGQKIGIRERDQGPGIRKTERVLHLPATCH